MPTRTLTSAVLLPVFLGLLAIFQLVLGGNALPSWIASIAIRQDHDPLLYLRVIAAFEIMVAVVLVGLGRNGAPLAWSSLIVIGFTAVAECSAAFTNESIPTIVMTVIVLAVSILLAVMLTRAPRTERTEEEATRTGAPRWVALVFLILISCAVVLNIPIAPRTIAEGRPLESPHPYGGTSTPVFDFNTDEWTGRDVKDIQLATYTPEVVRYTAEGRSLIILYNLGCGECHDLFDVHFSEGFHVPVIAIEIPPAEHAVMAPNARTDPVDCPDCTFTSLPPGPLWLLTPPTVLLVEDGRILCVESEDPTRCIDDA